MIEKLNAVLDLFTRERPEWAASEVAQALAMPRSTSYRLLARVSTAGFLDNDPASGRYRLSIRLATLGALAQHSTQLQRVAHPVLQQLASEGLEMATLMVRSGLAARVIDVVEGPRLMSDVPPLIGCLLPLHASAGGKVLLAYAGDDERRSLYRRGLPAQTPATTTDPDVLEAELRRVREQGHAVVRGEWHAEMFGVAAPIRGQARAVVGAITLGGPRARVTDARLEALAALAVSAAQQVSAAIAERRLESAERAG